MLQDAHFQEQESEESYFISMTDIMVGMLFVFIILLMFFVFQIQNTTEPMVPLSEHKKVLDERNLLEKKLNLANLRIDELLKEIERLKVNQLEKYLTAADRDRTQILVELQKSMKEAGITVQIIPDQGILRLPEELLFASGKSSIEPGSKVETSARALAFALLKVLPCFSVGPASSPSKGCNPNASFVDAIFVEGHTDNTPIFGEIENGIKDNLSLSARRATNTLQAIYLLSPRLLELYSISPSQEGYQLGEGNSPLLNAAAFGETRPAFSNDTNESRSRNRRIDLRLLMYSPRTESLDRIRKLIGQ